MAVLKGKRIYRIRSKGKIAGICAGIADMYGLDPTMVRLAAVFLCIITTVWPLVITYLVGWLLIPDITELQGEDFTKTS